MRGILFAVTAAVLTSACGQTPAQPQAAAIQSCEDYLKGKLRAPASYHRVSANGFRGDDGQWTVLIEYDAVNAFNAPLRNTQVCYFPMRNGQAVTTGYIDHDSIGLERGRALEANLLNSITPSAEPTPRPTTARPPEEPDYDLADENGRDEGERHVENVATPARPPVDEKASERLLNEQLGRLPPRGE